MILSRSSWLDLVLELLLSERLFKSERGRNLKGWTSVPRSTTLVLDIDPRSTFTGTSSSLGTSSDTDPGFLSREEIEAYVNEGVVTHTGLAFSRDTDKKVYIQHKMNEDAELLATMLEDGVFYVRRFLPSLRVVR